MCPPAVVMNNSGSPGVKVPGYGLAIDHVIPVGETFLQGYEDGCTPDRFTQREIDMLRMMNSITDKEDWTEKVFDDNIVRKWRSEAKIRTRPTATGMSDKMFQWCISELKDKAKAYKETNLLRVFDADTCVVKSDALVPADLQKKLSDACKAFLEAIGEEKDWHPRSDGKVLNLVHPSLFPLVYGQSRILPTGRINLDDTLSSFGKGEIIQRQHTLGDPNSEFSILRYFSENFQWLPCDVNWRGTDDLHVTSYINNLHPVHHKELYGIIEALISKSITLWQDCLFKWRRRPHRIECDEASYKSDHPSLPRSEDEAHKFLCEYAKPEGLGYWIENHLNEDGDYLSDSERNADLQNQPEKDLMERFSLSTWSLADYIWKHKRELIYPEPGDYNTAGKPWSDDASADSVDLRTSFPQGLQIIVKIASIELSPQTPEYSGGNWHVEGQKNEHIAATALYYYDCHNVTESRLRFRQTAELDCVDMKYEQDDHGGLEKIYGLEDGDLRDGAKIQELGSVVTKEGRILGFPNSLQHKVEPFRLEDPEKPGWRRFIVLWLVDPHYRILSTANVPPQQYHWWTEELLKRTDNLGKLPTELAEKVLDEGKTFTMSLDEAKEIRLKLMDERTRFSDSLNDAMEYETYNFCEH